MADVVDPATRSRMMAGIRGKNTAPEILIRKGLHARGFRFRLHDRSLPGAPDLVLRKHRAVIEVNGCFWHAHDCHLFKWPSGREEFWRAKITSNKDRDARNHARLLEAGWRVLVIWECALKGKTRLAPEQVLEQTAAWLRSGATTGEIGGASA